MTLFHKLQFKISDLLKNKSIDHIGLKNIFIRDIPNLNPEGILGELLLQSLDSHSILVTLKNLTCTLRETCDACTQTYEREIFVPFYSARFVDKISTNNLGDEDADIFLIDTKKYAIDIEEMIYHAIGLETPLLSHCNSCQKRPDLVDLDD